MRFAWAKGSGNWAGVWRDGNTTEAMRLSGLTGYVGYRLVGTGPFPSE